MHPLEGYLGHSWGKILAFCAIQILMFGKGFSDGLFLVVWCV